MMPRLYVYWRLALPL